MLPEQAAGVAIFPEESRGTIDAEKAATMNRHTTYPMLHAEFLQRRDTHPKLIVHRLDMRPKPAAASALMFRLPASLTVLAGVALYWLLS